MKQRIRSKGKWLRRELLLRLMMPLLAIVVIAGAFGVYNVGRLIEQVFDRWLFDSAGSVATLLRFDEGVASIDIPSQAKIMLLFDDVDQIWFSVTQAGQLLAGQAGIPDHGEDLRAYKRGHAFNAYIGNQKVRVVRVVWRDGGAPVTVLMAETLIKRRRAELDLLVLLWPVALLVVAAAVAAIMLAVRRTVRPLEAIAMRWNQRAHVSLEPIGVDDVPRELMPFASSHNDLLARIRTMLERERQFAATAAHQLRTSLAGLQLGLSRAADAKDAVQMRKVIGELSASTQRAARLVQQLLAFGSLDPEARGNLDFRSTNLVALAQDVGATYVEQALAKSIDFELTSEDRPIMLSAQPELLAEALSNLIDNAIRYTPQGGRVWVDFEDNPPVVRVSDSGPGIAEDERQVVFEHFVRGRQATGDGSGLGLAIVRDILTMHGAAITLTDSPWGGLTATLRFPESLAGELRAAR